MSLYRITPNYNGKQIVSMRVHTMLPNGLWDIVCAGHPDCILADLPYKAWHKVSGVLFRKPKLIYYHDFK
jgi:hypothetical protein